MSTDRASFSPYLTSELAALEAGLEERFASARTPDDVTEVSVSYLGRSGRLSKLLLLLPAAPSGERAVLGQRLNATVRRVGELAEAAYARTLTATSTA